MRDSNPSEPLDGSDTENHSPDKASHNTGHSKELDVKSSQSADGRCGDADASGEGAEHNKNIMSELPGDLRIVVQAWPDLPEHLKNTIVTLVKSAGG